MLYFQTHKLGWLLISLLIKMPALCHPYIIKKVITDCEPAAIQSIQTLANPVCGTAATTLTAIGVSGTNATVSWYTAANAKGNYLGKGITLSNAKSGIYYARVTADCGACRRFCYCCRR